MAHGLLCRVNGGIEWRILTYVVAGHLVISFLH